MSSRSAVSAGTTSRRPRRPLIPGLAAAFGDFCRGVYLPGAGLLPDLVGWHRAVAEHGDLVPRGGRRPDVHPPHGGPAVAAGRVVPGRQHGRRSIPSAEDQAERTAGGLIRGHPTAKAPVAGDNVLPVNRVIRALGDRAWSVSILASPEPETTPEGLRAALIAELGLRRRCGGEATGLNCPWSSSSPTWSSGAAGPAGRGHDRCLAHGGLPRGR